jgi:hypothetical protein
MSDAIRTLNETASEFATHSSTIAASESPIAAGLGFVPASRGGEMMISVLKVYYTH